MRNLSIRCEHSLDIDAIHAIEVAAFGREFEATLVDKLRAAGALLLSQVALLDGELVGHAAYSLVTVGDGENTNHFPALGPIAVAPAYQGRGIGAALIKAGLGTVAEMGYGLLFLVGHPSYYPRFGFQPAVPLGFTSDYVEEEGAHEHFMVAVLDENVLSVARGQVRFHPAFDES